jgi:hypothetical protein
VFSKNGSSQQIDLHEQSKHCASPKVPGYCLQQGILEGIIRDEKIEIEKLEF